VTYNGVEAVSNTITLTVTVNQATLTEQIAALEDTGDIHHSLAKQLTNRLAQAEHHYQKGHLEQAIKHLNDFRKSLDKGDVSEEIASILTNNIDALEQSYRN
jgi:arginine/lysine/ornithine decarboxylase